MLGDVLNNEKINFLSEGLRETLRKEYENWQIEVKGFILSTTSYQELQKYQASIKPKGEYEEKNILFLEDPEWVKKLFESLRK
jgi:hypothetical protein